MTWKEEIKKEVNDSDITELVRVIFDFQKEKKIKNKDLEQLVKNALMEIEMIHGEMAEESRVDRLWGSRFERVINMTWRNQITKMMTPLDALDEIADLIKKDASSEELNRWLRKAIQAGHIRDD